MRDAAKAGYSAGGSELGSVDANAIPDRDIGPEVRRSGNAGKAGVLSDLTQARIGTQLKSLYDNILQQPVPDRFRDLIDRLDAEEPKTR